MSFVTTDEFSMRVTKITSRIGVSSTHSLPFYFFSKFKLNELWPYYQKRERLSCFNTKGFYYSYAVYIKEELPFVCNLSLENSADSYICFRLVLLHSVSYFFFLC